MSLYARRWYQAERFDGRIVSLQIFYLRLHWRGARGLGGNLTQLVYGEGSAFFCQRAVPPGQAVAEIRH